MRRRLPPPVAMAVYVSAAVAAMVGGRWLLGGLLLCAPLLYVLTVSLSHRCSNVPNQLDLDHPIANEAFRQ